MSTMSLHITIFIFIASCLPALVYTHSGHIGYCTIVPNRVFCEKPLVRPGARCKVISLEVDQGGKNEILDRPICKYLGCRNETDFSCVPRAGTCMRHGVKHCKDVCGDDNNCPGEICVGNNGVGCLPPHPDHIRSVYFYNRVAQPPRPPVSQPSTPARNRKPSEPSTKPTSKPLSPNSPPSVSKNSLWLYITISAALTVILAVIFMVYYVIFRKRRTPEKVSARYKPRSEDRVGNVFSSIRSETPSNVFSYPTGRR